MLRFTPFCGKIETEHGQHTRSFIVSPTQAAAGGRKGATSLVIIAIVAATAALYLGRDLFAPVVLALLFAAVLRPMVTFFGRIRIPAPASATIIVLGALALIGTGVFLLAQPVQDWVNRAPQTFAAARTKLDKLRRPVEKVSQAVEKVQQEVTGGDKAAPTQAPAASSPSPAPTVLARVFGTTTAVLTGGLEVLVIVFLLLATGDLFYRKVSVVLPRPAKGTREATLADAESVVRHYLVVTALINAGQGVVVGLVMQLIGLPNALLWGLMTFVFEFLPYLGGVFMMVLLTVVAFATFDSIGHVLLAPGAYLAITTIQNNAVSPFAYGNRLKLNPVVVLLATLVGWFLWGVTGAFVAIPLLAAVKVLAEHADPRSRLAEVLGE
jgi:predicted PurR-regulated permease PerM